MAPTVKEFIHLRIALEETEEATNNFADNNIIGEGGFGNVYRGKLKRSGKLIKISVRRLDRKYGQGDVEFWTEVSMLSSLNHENIVSMSGFCDEKDEKIIVNRFYPKGSLLMHLSDPTLRWSKRANIAAVVVKAIDYLHSEVKPNYVIYHNINSSTILLDENWVPKLSGFEFSIKQSTERKNKVILYEKKAIGTCGYIDPEIYRTGGVIHKSDIYCFGVVLLELLCGRRANEGNTLLAPLATSHYKNHTLPNIIHPGLRNQIHKSSYKVFPKVAFLCLASNRSERREAYSLYPALSVSCRKENVDGTSGLLMDEKDDTFEERASGLPTDEKDDTWEQSASGLPMDEKDDTGGQSASGLQIDERDDTGEQSASGLPTDEKDDIGEQKFTGLPMDEKDDTVKQKSSGLPTDEKDDTGEQSALCLQMDKKDDIGEQSALALPTDEKDDSMDDSGEHSASGLPADEKVDTGELSASSQEIMKGGLTQESDIYTSGVLYEFLCSRRANIDSKRSEVWVTSSLCAALSISCCKENVDFEVESKGTPQILEGESHNSMN